MGNENLAGPMIVESVGVRQHFIRIDGDRRDRQLSLQRRGDGGTTIGGEVHSDGRTIIQSSLDVNRENWVDSR